MGNEWKVCTIEQLKSDNKSAIAIGPFGSRMKADCYVPSGVPVIRGNNISSTRSFVGDFVYVSKKTADEMRFCNVFPGDLVFPHRGAIGEVGIIPENAENRYMISTSLMKLSCNRELADPLFIFYYFRSEVGRHSLLKNASTVGTPGIGQPLSSLRSISLSLPPISEQKAIAHILGTLDDKIELLRQMNETLEAMARALFKSWFVDFDPVRKKAAGLPTGLPPEIEELFPDSFEDSELGEIPKGWRAKPLGDVIAINPSRKLPKGDVATYLEMKNIPQEGPNPTGWELKEFSGGSKFKNGDTLVARITPCLENGKTALIQVLEPEEVAFGSTEYLVLASNGNIPPQWIYLLARDRGFREYAISQMNGSSGRQRVERGSIEKYKLTFPPNDDIFDIFGELTGESFVSIHKNASGIRTLQALRDSLLPKLISGELEIKDIDKILEPAP